MSMKIPLKKQAKAAAHDFVHVSKRALTPREITA